MKREWVYGDKARLADAVGISGSWLSQIVNGKKECKPELAKRLAEASRRLGYNIPREVWAFTDKRIGNMLFAKRCAISKL